RHIDAFARQLKGDRLADALAAARDDRHLAGQSQIHVKVPRRCPREARRARERLAHLPPELPRAKANPERRDEPEELRVHRVHPDPRASTTLATPGEASDRVQTGEGLDTFGTSKFTESLSRTKLLVDRVPWLQQFFSLHRGALVATMDSRRSTTSRAAGLWIAPGGKHGDRDGRLRANRDSSDAERRRTLRIDD